MKVISINACNSTAKSSRRIRLAAGVTVEVEWDGVECFSTTKHGMGTFFQKKDFEPVKSVKPVFNLSIDSITVSKVGEVSKTEIKDVKLDLKDPYEGWRLGRALRTNPHINKEEKMNTGAVLFAAVSNDFTTIEVNFRDSNKNTYTYKAKLSENLMVGDVVVVDTPSNGFTIVDVVAVHTTPQFIAGINYKWIVQRVDNSSYKQQLAIEADLSKAAEIEARELHRKSTLKVLKKAYPEGSEVRSILEKYVL